MKSYADGVRGYINWCQTNQKPVVIDRRQLRQFIDGLLTAGAKQPPQWPGIWRYVGSPPG